MDKEPTTEIQDHAAEEEPRLPWHKPEVERLNVSLDTGFTKGSVTDAGTGSTPG